MWFENLTNQNTEPPLLTYTVRSIMSDMRESGPMGINPRLEQIVVSECNPFCLLAILRATFSFRDKIPRWQNLEQETRLLMEKKGMDSKSIMKGLDKPY